MREKVQREQDWPGELAVPGAGLTPLKGERGGGGLRREDSGLSAALNKGAYGCKDGVLKQGFIWQEWPSSCASTVLTDEPGTAWESGRKAVAL